MLCQDVWSRGLQPYWCFSRLLKNWVERANFLFLDDLFWVVSLFVLVFVLLRAPVGLCNAMQRHYGPDLRRGKRGSHQVSHTHQVVGSTRERKDPIHLQRSAMPHLA